MGTDQTSTRTPIISPAEVEQLKRKGLNQSEIAEKYGITRQYVSHVKRTSGNYSKTPREEVREHYPWVVPVKMHAASPWKRLRDHGEFMATGGKGMSKDKLKRLVSFYNKLEQDNVVLEFDPSIPPSEGIKCGGFAFRPRESSDGDLIIRVNEHTTLTPQGRVIWRFPPRRPVV